MSPAGKRYKARETGATHEGWSRILFEKGTGKLVHDLRNKPAKAKSLSGIHTICGSCKWIRDGRGNGIRSNPTLGNARMRNSATIFVLIA